MKLAAHSVGRLESQHRWLEEQIHELDRRGTHLTPIEQRTRLELKKLRLHAKDRLTALGRH